MAYTKRTNFKLRSHQGFKAPCKKIQKPTTACNVHNNKAKQVLKIVVPSTS